MLVDKEATSGYLANAHEHMKAHAKTFTHTGICNKELYISLYLEYKLKSFSLCVFFSLIKEIRDEVCTKFGYFSLALDC